MTSPFFAYSIEGISTDFMQFYLKQFFEAPFYKFAHRLQLPSLKTEAS